MIYRLFVYDKRAKEYQSNGNYKTRKSAEKKAEPHIKKGREIKIVALPSNKLKVGMKIYKADKELYGTIIREDECFWYVNRGCKDEDDEMFFLKDNFLDKYIEGILVMKE